MNQHGSSPSVTDMRLFQSANQAVSRQYGHAIALTSANESGALSTLAVQEFSNLWNEVRLPNAHRTK